MNNCGVIEDLLPLYIDGVCSGESKEMIEQHIITCDGCKKILNGMKEDIRIPEDHEGNIVKRMKRRILIEKIVAMLIVLWILGTALIISFFYFCSERIPMTEVDVAEEISITEDTDGNVLLARSGQAIDAKMIIMDRYNTVGEVIAQFEDHIINKDVDDSHVVVEIVLYENYFDKWIHHIWGAAGTVEEEQSILFNKNEKSNIEKIVMKDGNDNSEHVLWEK